MGETRSHDDETGPDVIAAVRADPPALDRSVPAQRANHRAEKRRLVEAEMLSDALAMFVDLRTVGKFLRRNVVQLFEQRDITIGIIVALDPGVAVPVPGAAEVPAQFDDPEIGDAGFLDAGRADETSKASAEDGDVEILRDRIPDYGRRVRIGFVEVREFSLGYHILLRAFGTQALVALLSIFFPQCGDIDVVRGLRRLALHIQSHGMRSPLGH